LAYRSRSGSGRGCDSKSKLVWIEKSSAGASLLAQVIVAKTADHLPLHRQEKIFQRHGADISRKTMGGWLAQCADLLKPLYGSLKQVLFQSKVIGTDDTSVKVLDVKLPFARTGRIWPYYGDADHPVIVYDYTATRARAGPEKFSKDIGVTYRRMPMAGITHSSRTQPAG
jgi:hypothetical protein